MAFRHLAVGLAILAAVPACAATITFACERDEQCRLDDTTGICEPGGACSFGDFTCPSGRRYDELASDDVAGHCLGPPPGDACMFDVAVGDATMCARRRDGGLTCWGRNADGQLTAALGNPQQLVPASLPALAAVSQVELGGRHGCVRTDGDALRCLGKNASGQLGNDTTNGSATPVDVIAVGPTRDLDVHADHSCAVANVGGTVTCWGKNEFGQLGVGDVTDRRVPVQVLTATGALTGAVAVTAGKKHSCAIADQRLWCWGQLGDAPTAPQLTAVEIGGVGAVVGVVAGNEHTCALDASDGVWCWGKNADGQIGTGAAGGYQASPLLVALPGVALELALGHDHSCARLVDGSVWCWGRNVEGQIADPPSASVAAPVAIAIPGPASAIAAGYKNTCTVIAGELWCRGDNTEGQLGTGEVNTLPNPAPERILVECP